MTLLIVSFIAGILTVLAPCVLPLLPVIIGSSVGARSKATPFIVIGSLALSILLFTYLLKASTALIDIPTVFWSYLSGSILAGFGLILVFPKLWESLPFIAKASGSANQLMGKGYQKKSIWGDVLVGASLGPIFSTCSPTYFVILGAVLPASFWLGTTYLVAYILGLVLILGLIALLGQRLTSRLNILADGQGKFKRGLGIVFLILGLAIISGLDKKFEAAVLNTGFLNISIIEQKILDSVIEEPSTSETSSNINKQNINNNPELIVNIPPHLASLFPKTEWSKSDPRLSAAMSGGPAKDGIPALDKPQFESIKNFSHSGDIQGIVLVGKNEVKVYPYNILTWHEIVNDEIDGMSVGVTFCPLCGSAIVYNRTLPDGQVSTLGVSGSLLESNMIMYDRNTENLWQQSTGQTLAGSFYPNKLEIVPFQLLSISEIKTTYPDALVLSEDTGYSRDYARNPYSGYDTNDSFVFDPSHIDTKFPAKTIMVVIPINEITLAVPWLKLREAGTAKTTIGNKTYTLVTSETGELEITDDNSVRYPFYFEMWFSFAIQHKGNTHIISL